MDKFYGTGVAMVTPFHSDGAVDYEGLKKLIDQLITSGVDYLVSLGTTGEAATLTQEEKKKILAFTADCNAKRVPLVVGIGGNNTREIIKQMQELDLRSYEAILSVSPYYNKPTQEGIYQHYKAIAANAPLPIILYNVPGRTGSNMTAATTIRLAREFENIIAIKEASANFNQLNQIMRDKPEKFLLISGDDPITLPMIAMGAVGVISVVANVCPKIVSNMVKACLRANFQQAKIAHYKLLELTDLSFIEGNPAGVKEALKQLGICGNTLRLPLVPVSSHIATRIGQQVAMLLHVADTICLQ